MKITTKREIEHTLVATDTELRILTMAVGRVSGSDVKAYGIDNNGDVLGKLYQALDKAGVEEMKRGG